MGGYGSGFQGRAKATTTARQQLHIGRLAQAGALAPGARTTLDWNRKGGHWGGLTAEAVSDNALALDYSLNGHPRRDVIELERTPCPFGGTRPWFVCPWCGRRCATLYSSLHGFCCRTCGDLQYPSTRERGPDRAVRKADRIRARLGWPAGVAFGHGPKPPGMHWRTFDRLVRQHDRYAGAFFTGAAADLERMLNRRG